MVKRLLIKAQRNSVRKSHFFHLAVLGQPGKYQKKSTLTHHFLCQKKNVSEVAYRSKHKSLDYELLGRKGKKMSSFHKHASGKNLEESMKRVYAKHSSKARGATFGNGRKLKICSRLARATWQEHLFFNP